MSNLDLIQNNLSVKPQEGKFLFKQALSFPFSFFLVHSDLFQLVSREDLSMKLKLA